MNDDTRLDTFTRIVTYKPYYRDRKYFLERCMEEYSKRKKTGKHELAYAEIKTKVQKDYELWKTKTEKH